MRLYSYVFHGLLSLAMILIALVSWFGGSHSLNLLLLPWQDEALRWLLLSSGLVGLVIVWLATRDFVPILFLLWSLLILVVLARGFFLGWVHYLRGPYPLSWALLLSLGALLAVVGGWIHYRRPKTASS